MNIMVSEMEWLNWMGTAFGSFTAGGLYTNTCTAGNVGPR